MKTAAMGSPTLPRTGGPECSYGGKTGQDSVAVQWACPTGGGHRGGHPEKELQ